jgi:acetylornithine deacetylase/succinyl-diaminopimelate desuccinylase-like protein
VRHTVDPAEHANAIVRATPIIEWLTNWGRQYEEQHTYRFEFGSCVPKVGIGAIRAGQPFMPIVSPERCYLYVDVRLTPEQTAMDVDRELRHGLGALGIPHLLECTLYRRGYEATGAEPLLDILRSAHQAEFGSELGGVSPGQSSSWRDTNPFNELGIPAISYGPSAGKGGAQAWTAISDLVQAARMYARVMVGMSGAEGGGSDVTGEAGSVDLEVTTP